jgi:Acetyltransferase (GNAT) family.
MYEVVHNPNDMKKIILNERYLKTILEYESLYLKNDFVCMESSKVDIIKSLNSKCSVGYIDEFNGKLLGYSLLYVNEYHVAFIEKCFVLPEFRGGGLQKEMILKNISCACFHHVLTIFSMCSPINFASLSNFEKTEFKRIGDVVVSTPRGESHSRIILERRIADWK